MERPDETKVCPFCSEEIKAAAVICRFCNTDLREATKDKSGTFVRARLTVSEKTYSGEIFVPDYLNRLSDVINDRKQFIILRNAVEENHVVDVPIGFLAINKNQVVRLELKHADEEKPFEVISRIIEWR
jgi:hypothetical protein